MLKYSSHWSSDSGPPRHAESGVGPFSLMGLVMRGICCCTKESSSLCSSNNPVGRGWIGQWFIREADLNKSEKSSYKHEGQNFILLFIY